MQTRQQRAEGRIRELLGDAYENAKVFKGGGDEAIAVDLPTAIHDAAESSLLRLYPNFGAGDNEGWAKVYSSAAKGSPDALISIGFKGEPLDNPVCREIHRYIGAGKNGSQIRNEFGSAPNGWPQDTIDGGLQVLLVAGLIRAHDDRRQTVSPTDLERKQIGKAMFKIESTSISRVQLIQIRKLFQAAGLIVRPDDEKTRVGDLLERLETLADSAGGDAPMPFLPDCSFLEPIRLSSGNEQLMALYERRDEITEVIPRWTAIARQIEARLPIWESLVRLLDHAVDLPDVGAIREEAQAIYDQRLLLDDPDAVRPLRGQLEDLLRRTLLAQQDAFNQALRAGWDQLEEDASWTAISSVQQSNLAQGQQIDQKMDLQIGSYDSLVNTLEAMPLSSWQNRIDALSSRFARVREEAARLLTPQAQSLNLPRQTIHDAGELDAWLATVKSQIETALGKGPVILK